MVWQIGNYGFTLRLSPQIPEHLAEAAPTILTKFMPDTRPDFWAIHPGGSAIIDRLAKSFKLDESQVAASRAVLRDYGNLSSATILFVLAELQRSFVNQSQNAALASATISERKPLTGVAMAFGPGLVIEMAQLDYVPPIPTPLSDPNLVAIAIGQ